MKRKWPSVTRCWFSGSYGYVSATGITNYDEGRLADFAGTNRRFIVISAAEYRALRAAWRREQEGK